MFLREFIDIWKIFVTFAIVNCHITVSTKSAQKSENDRANEKILYGTYPTVQLAYVCGCPGDHRLPRRCVGRGPDGHVAHLGSAMQWFCSRKDNELLSFYGEEHLSYRDGAQQKKDTHRQSFFGASAG